MDKTSREYAEKLAKEKILESGNDFKIMFKDGYLTAIEETNVKGLQEALEAMNDYYIRGKELTDIELEDLHNMAITALKKSKEI